MNAREEIERLRKEFVLLNTEKERAEFDVRFRNSIESKSDEEKKEFARAFKDSASDAVSSAKTFCNELAIKVALKDILGIVSMAYISRVYFSRSKSWFSQKMNGNIKNGNLTSFTKEEMKTLSYALNDISKKITDAARSIA